MSADLIRIYNRFGEQVADVRASASRTWLLNKVGQAEFNIAQTNPNYGKEEVLEFGNYVVIENEKLPAWVGVIETPRKWGRRQVTIRCNSAEHVMSYAIGEEGNYLTGDAGEIFTGFVNVANKKIKSIVGVGEVQRDGKKRTDKQSNADILSQITSLADRSNNDFIFTPTISRGRLVISANWYIRLGGDVDYTLSEGKHFEFGNTVITEQDQISNTIVAYGDGSATKSGSPNITVVDQDSVYKYGVRMDIENYSGVSQLDTLEENAKEALAKRKQPTRVFFLNVTDTDNAWNNLRLGNNIGVYIWSAAFGVSAKVRIMGIEYNPKYKKVNLITEEVND